MRHPKLPYPKDWPRYCLYLIYVAGLLLCMVSTSIMGQMSTKERLLYREKTREMFQHGFESYMNYAFPLDELNPRLCNGRGPDPDPDNWGINDILGNFSLTLIDSLGTFAIMNDTSGFESAIRLTIDTVSFEQDTKVQVFEVNIRVLGSLISAHHLASSPDFGFALPWYRGQLLALAVDLADRLIPAFQTPTGIPYARVNLVSGVPRDEFPETCTAAAGTLLLEFGMLSRLTGNPMYETLAKDSLMAVWERRSDINLVGSTINVLTGAWVEESCGIGAGIDSFYEYLLKSSILFGEEDYMEMFEIAYAAIKKTALDSPDSFVFKNVNMFSGKFANTWVDALGAFWPGMQVLLGDVNMAIKLHEFYHTLWKRYNMMPERYDYVYKSVLIKTYPLRPEFVESTYYLYRATKDPYYLQVGAEIVRDLETYCWTECGFATIIDILAEKQSDRMESFFLSETVKYLYLLFDEDNFVNKLDSNFVFSTEGQFLHLPESLKRLKFQTRTQSSLPSPVGGSGVFTPWKLKRRVVQAPTCPVPKLPVRNVSLEQYQVCGAVGNLISQKDMSYIRGLTEPPKVPFVAEVKLMPISGASYQKGWIDEVQQGIIASELAGLDITLHYDKKADVYVIRRVNGLELPDGKYLHATDYALLFLVSSVQIPQSNVVEKVQAELLASGRLSAVEQITIAVKLKYPRKELHGILAAFGPRFDEGDVLCALMVHFPGAFPTKTSFFSQTPKKKWFGCLPYTEAEKKAVLGRIVLIPRGRCMFSEKVGWAQLAGAVGVIIVNSDETVFTMSPFEELYGLATNDNVDTISIPSLLVSMADGANLVSSATKDPDQLLRLSLSEPPSSARQLLLNQKPIKNLKIVKHLGQWASTSWRVPKVPATPWIRSIKGGRRANVMDYGTGFWCLLHCPLPKTSCARWWM